MHRSNSELDMNRYQENGMPNNVDKADDKKKRGRSPFRYVSSGLFKLLATVDFCRCIFLRTIAQETYGFEPYIFISHLASEVSVECE